MLICQAKDTFYATGPDFVDFSHMYLADTSGKSADDQVN